MCDYQTNAIETMNAFWGTHLICVYFDDDVCCLHMATHTYVHTHTKVYVHILLHQQYLSCNFIYENILIVNECCVLVMCFYIRVRVCMSLHMYLCGCYSMHKICCCCCCRLAFFRCIFSHNHRQIVDVLHSKCICLWNTTSRHT